MSVKVILRVFFIYFILIFSYSSASFADRFYEHLKANGIASWYAREHEEYIQTHLNEYIFDIAPEMLELSSHITKGVDLSETHFLYVGNGVGALGVFMENLKGISASNLPLSGFGEQIWNEHVFLINPTKERYRIPIDEYNADLEKHLTRFLPESLIKSKKKIVIFDTVYTATTIANVKKRVFEFSRKINASIEVETVGLIFSRARLEAEKVKAIGRALELDDYAVLHVLFYHRLLHKFSKYTRYEPGRDRPEGVVKNPAFDSFQQLIQAEMRRLAIPMKEDCEILSTTF